MGLAAALFCAAASLSATPTTELEMVADKQPPAVANRAFFDGREITFDVQRSRIPGRDFKFGPWNVGMRIARAKPSDHSPNMYIVVPGDQFERGANDAYKHNRLLSSIPKGGGTSEWDVYWALVIDPTLAMDFRSERELLVAAQEEFMPPADFSIDKVPAQAALREFLKVKNLEQLNKYRRTDKTLPGVLIVPAGFAIRGSAYDVDNSVPTNKASVAHDPGLNRR